VETELVFLGHDGSIDLLLKADNQDGLGSVAIDLENVTKITATFGVVLVESTDKAAGIITWDQPTYRTGEIRMKLGAQSIAVGNVDVALVVYDASILNGVVWDSQMPFRIIGEVEASSP
jgi:hypothetical protein